jgi:hypothetical protein
MQADYKASGWLALITAGALWVPLFDAAQLDTVRSACFLRQQPGSRDSGAPLH